MIWDSTFPPFLNEQAIHRRESNLRIPFGWFSTLLPRQLMKRCPSISGIVPAHVGGTLTVSSSNARLPASGLSRNEEKRGLPRIRRSLCAASVGRASSCCERRAILAKHQKDNPPFGVAGRTILGAGGSSKRDYG